MTNRFLQALEERVLVFDGAMGTAVQAMTLSIEDDYLDRENCTEILVRTRPELIAGVHESFLAVGCDAIETNTFGANELVFAEFDLVDQTRALNREAAELARAAADRYSTKDKPRFVVGSMGPGTRLVTLGNTTWEAMLASYTEQARGLLDGGVDVFLVETCQDLLQAKIAVNACLDALAERGKDHTHVPVMVQVTIETTGTMLLGTEIAAAANALAPFPVAVLGLNCATGPVEMAEHVRWLGRHWRRHISVLPNAGLPVLVEGRTEYPLRPAAFTEALVRMVEQDGVSIVGGCCGTTPEHLDALVKAIGGRPRVVVPQEPVLPAVSSLYGVVDLQQDASVLMVGERTNTSGSRAFKRMVEAEDWDAMVSLAREQVREGSHAIDVNVDYAGRDGAADMGEIVKRFVRQVNAPLMLDSTQAETLEAGLKHAGGRCIINSTNLEEGEERFIRIVRMAKRYGAALVMLTIDEDPDEAMARTAERKLEIAARMIRLATEHGLAEEDLIIDPLVLPVSTGMEADRKSGEATIEGVRRIKEAFPRVHTSVGLSNVSFGLRPAARVVLNSVFLHELREAGLTAAIVHASKILPRTRIGDERWEAALDLLYDRWVDGQDPLQRFIALFPAEEESARPAAAAVLTLEERLQAHIIDGEKQGLIETLEEARERYSPLDIINDHLLAGMKVVGELFGSGQMQLPFVLQSAEVMKMAVGYLEPFLDRVEGESRGRIVLATVKGDVHDIGKNLVDIILSNNGYTVYNLGIKQPIGSIIGAWREHQADAIGLSGLLVKSVMVMRENLEELNTEGISVPVLLGGAALSRNYAETELRGLYAGRTYYGQDAFDGLRIMDHLVSGQAAVLDREIEERVQRREEAMERGAEKRAQRRDAEAARDAEAGGRVRSETQVLPGDQVPVAPFLGSRVVEGIRLDDVFPFINRVALFRGQWQFKQGNHPDDVYLAMVEDDIEPVFERLKAQVKAEGILVPKVVYGYFEANADGDDVIVWNPQAPDEVLERFQFPRQEGLRRLCLADFFVPVDSGRRDVLGMMCVTVGPRATEETAKLFAANEYAEYLYLHGLSVETAEATAEFWHKRMRQELGIGGQDSPRVKELFQQGYRGSRYSFGYPACPNMEDQEKLFRLLDPSRIGCSLTDNFQIDPEQSTSAIVVHHPAARYFNV